MMRTSTLWIVAVFSVFFLLAGCGDEDADAEQNHDLGDNNAQQEDANQDDDDDPDGNNGGANNSEDADDDDEEDDESVDDDDGDDENSDDPPEEEEEGPWADLPPEPWNTQEAGPFEVAYRYEGFDYTPRAEDETREVGLSIWYPTFEDDGDHARYADWFHQPGVWQDAEPALRDPAPVLIFSHGNGGISTQSFFFTEYFASHGWIVISPDHTGNTFLDMEGGGINLESAVYRPQDLTQALDYVLQFPDDDPLSGYFSDKIAVSGHSFGGYTTLAIAGATFPVDELVAGCDSGEIDDAFCQIFSDQHMEVFRDGFLDPRIQAAIPQTPGGAAVMADGLDEIDIPVFMWTAAGDITLPNHEEGDPLWEGLAGEHDVRIDAEATGHFTFSNMCDLVGDFVGQVADDGCGEEFMEPEVIHPLINTYSHEYLRYHLLGEEDSGEWFSTDHTPLHENLNFSFK